MKNLSTDSIRQPNTFRYFTHFLFLQMYNFNPRDTEPNRGHGILALQFWARTNGLMELVFVNQAFFWEGSNNERQSNNCRWAQHLFTVMIRAWVTESIWDGTDKARSSPRDQTSRPPFGTTSRRTGWPGPGDGWKAILSRFHSRLGWYKGVRRKSRRQKQGHGLIEERIKTFCGAQN